MAGAVPTLFRFDRWDNRIGTLPVAGGLVHTEELNGEDTIEFQSFEVPDKGDRLLWLDGDIWREHVVVRTEEPMAGLCSVYAESSLCEMLDDFIEEAQLVNRTALQALTAVLAPTRWSIAHCASLGTAGALIYHQNALWGLRRVAEVWKGEITPVIAVSGGRVASRSIRLDARRGSWNGLRFTYGKNMAGCNRTVLEQDVYTALYGFGAGLPYTDEDGNYVPGYRRKLTFGEINGGKNYVEDTAARDEWGRWNADRTAKVHSFGQVTFSDVTDPARLLALTRVALAEAVQAEVERQVRLLRGGEAQGLLRGGHCRARRRRRGAGRHRRRHRHFARPRMAPTSPRGQARARVRRLGAGPRDDRDGAAGGLRVGELARGGRGGAAG